MQRLFYRSLVLLAIITLMDWSIGKALEHMFFANTSGAPGYVINRAVSKPYDAYIMGASGAQRGYIPSLIGGELGMQILNTGEAGTNIFHNYATLQLVLKHHKPRLIIWDLTDADYYYRPDASKTGMIVPYYQDAEVRKLLYDLEPLNRIWLRSKIYPYNGKILSIVGSYIAGHSANSTGDNGYQPILGTVNSDLREIYLRQFEEVENSLLHRSRKEAHQDILIRKYFHAFIQLCQDNNIQLIAFHCPKAPLSSKVASSPLLSDELCAQLQAYEVPLYCIMPSKYPEMNDLNLYYDFSHLNHAGAQVFSKIVAEHLKKHVAGQSFKR